MVRTAGSRDLSVAGLSKESDGHRSASADKKRFAPSRSRSVQSQVSTESGFSRHGKRRLFTRLARRILPRKSFESDLSEAGSDEERGRRPAEALEAKEVVTDRDIKQSDDPRPAQQFLEPIREPLDPLGLHHLDPRPVDEAVVNSGSNTEDALVNIKSELRYMAIKKLCTSENYQSPIFPDTHDVSEPRKAWFESVSKTMESYTPEMLTKPKEEDFGSLSLENARKRIQESHADDEKIFKSEADRKELILELKKIDEDNKSTKKRFGLKQKVMELVRSDYKKHTILPVIYNENENSYQQMRSDAIETYKEYLKQEINFLKIELVEKTEELLGVRDDIRETQEKLKNETVKNINREKKNAEMSKMN